MKKISTKKLCLLAIFTAITVILGVYATFRIGNQIKVPTKFITVFLTGVTFGPFAGGMVGALADILNSVLMPVGAPLPQITAVEFICGVIYGLCFIGAKDNKIYYVRVGLCALLQFAIAMTIMSTILVDAGYFANFESACAIRFLPTLISFALQVAVMCALKKFVFSIKKIISKDKNMKNFKTYANSFQTKSRLGLESVGALCEKCGNPQDKLKFIHVAGTNGKGSTCAFLSCMLTDSGLKTGKFISPNMIDVTERISIDGKDITQKKLDKLLAVVEKAAKEVEKEKGAMPTQFEIWTAAAFIYFAQEKCDIVVLETGLGGRLDATNIIKAPLCSVITKIDVDHTEYLGDTIEKIAFEKAGIIKENSAVIATPQSDAVMNVLSTAAKERNCSFNVADKPENGSHEGLCEMFDIGDMKDLKIHLAGLHQTENAALAVATAMYLGIDEKYIRSGLERARNIGRFEKIDDNPTVIFDGAHNLNGTTALIDAVERYFTDEKLSIIYGAMADKDIDASLELMKEHGFCEKAEVFTVQVKDNPRAETAETLAKKFRQFGFNANPCENIQSAYDNCIKKGNTTLICGSLYLYKDLKES